IDVEIEDQMKTAYLDYAMSVIVGRALPDVRDGLKPVHRRILHAMNERAWRSDRPYVKSAKIVGEVIGNFHPHGDTAVYETMVRMAQDFSMRLPIIDGQGNFGSVDGDPAAAYRYTEARLEKSAEELLSDIDKETVDFIPNFDDTRKEPVVLPAAFPNLLVNGSEGIAVGMATKIPPNNLGEIIDATVQIIDNPEITSKQLLKYIKGPDFPTGGSIMGNDGIYKAYTTGRGSIIVRGKYTIEENKKGREEIIISEIPYQVNKATLVARIAELVNEKEIEGISELRDESDRRGMRIYIGLKKDANSSVIINQLLKHTQLQTSFGVILLSIVDGVPKILDIKAMLAHYINHRREVVIRRTKYDLKKAEERAHILEGLKIALENIDEVIAIIKASKNPDEASVKLMKRFSLSEIQAKAILDMRLQRLTSLEIKKIIDELKELLKLIAELKALLASETKMNNLIKTELVAIKDKYSDKRRTEIVAGGETSTDFDIEDLIADEEMVVSITNDGFIRRMPIDTFKKQRRGGKGVIGMSSKREDFVKMMTVASAHDTVFLFSNKGKIFALKTYEIPVSTKTSRGKSLKGIINLATGENITAICSIKTFETDDFLCLATRHGILKKTGIAEFSNARKGGIICINLKKEDELVDVKVVEKESDLVIASREGLLLRTNLQKMRSMGRSAAGIIGMRLDKNDHIIGMDIVKDGSSLFVITEKGFGKRVPYNNFANKGRGGKGMAYLKITDKNGTAAGIRSVLPDDEIIITAMSGMTIRLVAKDVSSQGRSTVGIKLLELTDPDIVSDFAVITEDDDE
ncbi:MAG TPA: DNA gyrase subunit A, partial [Spirochaetota bacterium]|nr:DNA gyrase subunit A [Spirochaetota bacterium]